MRVHLLVVDPQKDFCIADDGKGNKGQLVVAGAEADMTRTAAMINRIGGKLDDIFVTLDSHQTFGIERPRFWKRVGDGAHPAPFTVLGIHPDGKRIVKIDFSTGAPVATEEEYTTYLPSYLHQHGPVVDPTDPTGKKRLGAFGYLQALATKQRYPHVVWTEHCCVGTWGWSIVDDLALALRKWEWDGPGRVNYVVKGNNPWTEHFSGVQAEVPDPDDPTTQVNTGLIKSLAEADIIAITGEALSHCVANTVTDIATQFAVSNPQYIEKLVLLTDASSNVTGFDFLGKKFVQDLTAKGMKLDTTTNFLA